MTFQRPKRALMALGTSFIVLCGLGFLIMFIRSMIDPAVPYLVKNFVATEEATVTILGLLTSIGTVTAAIASVLGGTLADRMGKKKVIVLSVGVYPLALLCYLLSESWYWLIPASLLGLMTYGLSQPSFDALIADLTPRKKRATAYGIYNFSWLLSQIPAPIIGGWLALRMGIKSPFLTALVLSFPVILLALRIVEPKIGSGCAPSPSRTEQTWSQPFTSIMPSKTVIAIFCGMGLINGLANGILNPAISAYLIFRLKADVLQMSIANSIGYALVSALVQVPGGGIADKIGRKRTMLVGLLVVPMVMILGYTQDLVQFTLVLALICAIGNASRPAHTALLMDLIAQDKRAKASGFAQMANTIGMAIGSIIGGFLWVVFEPEVFITFLFSSILFFSTAPFILLLKEPKPEIERRPGC